MRLYTLSALVLANLAGAAAAQEMTFEWAQSGGNCNGCEWVAAQGEITETTPDAFRQFLAENGPVDTLLLHSPGGSLVAGIELGALIRGATTSIGRTIPLPADEAGEGKLSTTRNGICASACAFAFMGGVDRWASEGSLLGVHQFYSVAGDAIDNEIVQSLVGLTLMHTVRMGVDSAVIARASDTHASDMYWLSAEEMVAYGLDTLAARIEPWWMEPRNAGLVLKTTHRESARRVVDITLYCRAATGVWYLRIDEISPLDTGLRDGALFNFAGSLAQRPQLTLGTEQSPLIPHDMVLQQLSGSTLSVEIVLPDRVERAPGEYLSFAPDFPQALGSLLQAEVVLPGAEWLTLGRNNCV